jgi:nitrogen fixation-related uncharacterized protein
MNDRMLILAEVMLLAVILGLLLWARATGKI